MNIEFQAYCDYQEEQGFVTDREFYMQEYSFLFLNKRNNEYCEYNRTDDGYNLYDDGDTTGKNFFSYFGDGYGLGNGDGFLFVA